MGLYFETEYPGLWWDQDWDKAVINEDQAAVLHLQTVDIATENTHDLSQLSLCPGVLESQIPFESCSDCTRFLIEKAEDEIVYR